MSKTVPLQEDIHALIVNKQKELKRKRNITVRISDLLAMYVKYGIEKTEKLLGLIEDENDVIDGTKQNGGDGVKQNGVDGMKQNDADA